jgi:hypothetical protein
MKLYTIDTIISEAKQVEGLSRDFDYPEKLLTTVVYLRSYADAYPTGGPGSEAKKVERVMNFLRGKCTKFDYNYVLMHPDVLPDEDAYATVYDVTTDNTGAIKQTKFLGYAKDHSELDSVFSLSNQGRVLLVKSTGEVEVYRVLAH